MPGSAPWVLVCPGLPPWVLECPFLGAPRVSPASQPGSSRWIKSNELVVEYARRLQAGFLVRGLRAISDFEYEFEINQLNRHLNPGIESVYLMPAPEHSFVSSSGVKEVATFGGDVTDLVPPEVAARLVAKLG